MPLDLRYGTAIENALLDTVKTNLVFTGKSGAVGGFDQVKTLVSSQEKTFQTEDHQSTHVYFTYFLRT